MNPVRVIREFVLLFCLFRLVRVGIRESKQKEGL